MRKEVDFNFNVPKKVNFGPKPPIRIVFKIIGAEKRLSAQEIKFRDTPGLIQMRLAVRRILSGVVETTLNLTSRC